MDTLTGTEIQFSSLPLVSAPGLVEIPAPGWNGQTQIGVAGAQSSGTPKVMFVENLTGVTRTIGLLNNPVVRGLALLPAVNGNGSSDMVVFRLDKSAGTTSVDRIDTQTGLLIQ